MNINIDNFISFIGELGFYEYEDSIEDGLEFHYDYGEIKIIVYPDSCTYDIYIVLSYVDFSLDDYESFDGNFEDDKIGITENLETDIYKYWMTKELFLKLGIEPKEEVEDFLMCPGQNSWIGYFGLAITEKHDFAKQFFNVHREFSFPTNKEDKGIEDEVFDALSDYLVSQKYVLVDNFSLYNKSKQIMISTCKKSFDKYKRIGEAIPVSEVYSGKEYILFKAGENIFSLDENSLMDYENVSDIFDWGFRDTQYSIIDN